MRLKNKLAIVTAGASGMGRAGAETFAREGAKVAVVDLNEKGIADTVAAIKKAGGEACGITVDLSKSENCRKAVREAADKLGGIDIIWSHCGIPGTTKVEDINQEEYDFAMNLNVASAYFSSGEAVKYMKKRGGGSIILTASVSGVVGSMLSPIYSVAKFGVVGMCKSFALRFALDKIRCNVICPGLVDTPMLPEFMGRGGTPEERAATQARFMTFIPMGRLAQAQDIANAALFLASDESTYVTGVALPVDGGFTAR